MLVLPREKLRFSLINIIKRIADSDHKHSARGHESEQVNLLHKRKLPTWDMQIHVISDDLSIHHDNNTGNSIEIPVIGRLYSLSTPSSELEQH